MTLLQWICLLALGGLICLGALFFIRFLLRKSAQMDALRKVRNQLNGRSIQVITPNAYCLGLGRSWDIQWQGHGILVLTRAILHFRLWKRDLDLIIPLDRVEGVRVTREHSGRHLQVSYRGSDGQVRTVTWQVRGPEQWLRQMEELIDEENVR